MAIVTDGLYYYWHAKDGIQNGSLNNLATTGGALTLPVVGGTVQGDGAIRMDGIDDTLRLTSSYFHQNYGQPYTLELYIKGTTSSQADGAYFVDGGPFIGSFSWGNIYAEIGHQDGTYSAAQSSSNALETTNPILVTMTYNGGNNFSLYVNGSLVLSVPVSGSSALTTSTYPTVSVLSPAGGDPGWRADFYGLRIYDRVLTTTEMSQNLAEGDNIGLPVTRSKIGELRAEKAHPVTIYSINNNEDKPVRIMTANGKGFVSLVPVTDPAASNIRLWTPNGVMAFER